MTAFEGAFEKLRLIVADTEADRILTAVEAEARAERAAEIDSLRAELAQVSSEIVRFGIYGAPVPAVEALVKRADELVTENAALRAELEALKPTAIQACGRTQAVSGDEYPPCARHAGHRSAYCRSADGRTYFLAVDATQPNRTDPIEGGDR